MRSSEDEGETMQSSAAHIYVISAASVTVRWLILIAGQCSLFNVSYPKSGIVFSLVVRRVQGESLWRKKLSTRCVTIVMSSFFFYERMDQLDQWFNLCDEPSFINGWINFWRDAVWYLVSSHFSSTNELTGFLSLDCMYSPFQSLLDLECQNPELRGSSGGVEGGSLRLLMDFCIFSGLIASSTSKVLSNNCKHQSECKSV